METHTILWRRHDIPGHEACRLVSLDAGWQLAGAVVLAYEGRACRLDYEIMCDAQWLTRSATVTGWAGERTIEVQVGRDAGGRWRLNGRACDELAGCDDVDLNFSPATNLLPIRWLGMAVGESARVHAAWLRFPSFALEPLDQTYTRVEPRVYRYESGGGRFVASIRVDEVGFVTEYGEIWSRDVPA